MRRHRAFRQSLLLASHWNSALLTVVLRYVNTECNEQKYSIDDKNYKATDNHVLFHLRFCECKRDVSTQVAGNTPIFKKCIKSYLQM